MADGASIAGAAAGSVGGAVGGMLGLGLGVGQVNRRPNPFYDPDGTKGTGHNANAFNYGGSPTGRRDYVANLTSSRNDVEGRAAFQADYAGAEADRARGLDARAGQADMAGLMAARARGEVPSIAQMQADRQMGQAEAAQASAAASARGPAALALAQQSAAANTASAYANISGQAQIAAAQERLDAERAAAGVYGNLRQGDQSAEQLAGGRAQFQAGMQQANRDANDARAMGYEGLEARANEAELQAKQSEQAILAQSHGQTEQQQQSQAQHNASTRKGFFESIFSDARAKVPAPMISDMGGKVGVPLMGSGAGSGPAAASFDQLGPMNNLDVTGSLRAHSDFATRFADSAGSGPVGGGFFFSDTAAKKAAVLAQGRREGARTAQGGPSTQEMLDDRQRQFAGRVAAPDTMDPAAFRRALGQQVEQDRADISIDRRLQEQRDEDDRRKSDPAVGLGRAPKGYAAMRAAQAPAEEADPRYAGMAPGTADFERSEPKPENDPWWVRALGGFVGQRGQPANVQQQGFHSDANAKRRAFEEGAAYATKQITGEDMAPWSADDDGDEESPLPRDFVAPPGPNPLPPPPPAPGQKVDESPVAQSNRTLVGQPYAYKTPLTPPGQRPGEVNYGFMTQNLRQSPVAATAVKTDPRTGLDMVDRDKLLKVVASGVADLQRQQDETRSMIGGGRR